MPVPVFQSLMSFAIFGILLLIERRFHDRPEGLLITAAAALWGLSRFVDQLLWLGTPGHVDAVEVARLALSLAGWASAAVLLLRRRRDRPEEGSSIGLAQGPGRPGPGPRRGEHPAPG